jgi:hypothetical protein
MVLVSVCVPVFVPETVAVFVGTEAVVVGVCVLVDVCVLEPVIVVVVLIVCVDV